MKRKLTKQEKLLKKITKSHRQAGDFKLWELVYTPKSLERAIILAYNLGYKSGAEDGALGLVGRKALKNIKEKGE